MKLLKRKSTWVAVRLMWAGGGGRCLPSAGGPHVRRFLAKSKRCTHAGRPSMRCAEEAIELKPEGYEPIFKHARWLRANSSMSHFKILIIDDDNAFRKAISGFLRKQFSAIKIREAGNYREALRHTDDLDLVFVDISLPG